MVTSVAMSELQFPKDFNHLDVEARCRTLWDEHQVYRFVQSPGNVFSVDTPPPYVSAGHLHVGHAMSYAQAEFIVRFHRMSGRSVFYPMGFDDNGLPTERYVEKTFNIDKRATSRKAFRELCLRVTADGAAQYERLWRALGLSVDWNYRYSTIDDHCRRTSQKSFALLFRAGHIYRSTQPVLWDCSLETSLAQADLEAVERRTLLHEIRFQIDGHPDLVIATTRPELLGACVALYCHTQDARYTALRGRRARVPIFGHEVPILTDDDVDPAFGTGLMMVCTFGDGEDVRRWRRDNLDTRLCLTANGRMNNLAGDLQGRRVDEARKEIVEKLKSDASHVRSTETTQRVSLSERSGTPAEFMMSPQWFIRCLDLRTELLERSNELAWQPPWMKARLDQWIDGLRYDWNISRQRFYGVPIPVWYCQSCQTPHIPSLDLLPVDPAEDPCPVPACDRCSGDQFEGDTDVLDTWMTSSLTPLILTNWAQTPGRPALDSSYPMTVRVQGFEIIRTWLFYTLLKSHLHTNSLPWRDVMISGWGLNEQGKKISKRDLERFTDTAGYNRYEPYAVISKFGADALRYWAAGAHLGHDMRYNERDVGIGRKLVLKLWNAGRFYAMQLDAPVREGQVLLPFPDRTPEDRWIIAQLATAVRAAHAAFETYDYARAREAIDSFFWNDYCDDYLELVKDRFIRPEQHSEASRLSARSSLRECFRAIIGLYAPFVPFVTEELYQLLFRNVEGVVSLHLTRWPEYDPSQYAAVPEMRIMLAILRTVRGLRSTRNLSQGRELDRLVIDATDSAPDVQDMLRAIQHSLTGVARVRAIVFLAAQHPTGVDGLRVDVS
jgi:valyl-tRNA synthetase